MKSLLVLIGLLSLAVEAKSQDSSPWLKSAARQKAPLYLITNGGGRVFPLHNGQMLRVGQKYVMTAIPDRGRRFANWNPVTVFTFVEHVADQSGNFSTVTNTVVSPVSRFNRSRTLGFWMQPVQVIFDIPGVRTVTQSSGWEANFVPVRDFPR